MKIKTITILLVCALAHGIDSVAMKRKHEEPETSEQTKTSKIEAPQVVYNPRSLRTLSAKRVIDNFLQTSSDIERDRLQKEYARLIPEMKEYIQIMINMPINQEGQTYLHLAAIANNQLLIEQLLFLGANGNLIDLYGVAPLLYAAKRQPAAIIDLFLAKGANPYDRDLKKRNILFYAIDGMNAPLIDYLLRKKQLNPNIKDYNEVTPLFYAFANLIQAKTINDQNELKKIVTSLITFGGISNSYYSGNPLITIVTRYFPDDAEFIAAFVEHGADPNATSEDSYPLGNIIFEDYSFYKRFNNIFRRNLNYGLIRYMIQHGAKLEATDYELIVKSGNEEKLKKALENVDVFVKEL